MISKEKHEYVATQISSSYDTKEISINSTKNMPN
jgi:hypothetical protein